MPSDIASVMQRPGESATKKKLAPKAMRSDGFIRDNVAAWPSLLGSTQSAHIGRVAPAGH
jgi:hypothetical protein